MPLIRHIEVPSATYAKKAHGVGLAENVASGITLWRASSKEQSSYNRLRRGG